MPFGPDDSFDKLRPNLTVPLSVAPGLTIKVNFAFTAAWENAVIIYRSGAKLLERGNFSRSNSSWSFKNSTRQTVGLEITGWHKTSPPDARKKWIQSPFKKKIWRHPLYAVGFEDSGDNNFNDAIVSIVMQ